MASLGALLGGLLGGLLGTPSGRPPEPRFGARLEKVVLGPIWPILEVWHFELYTS
jgi:hypothetical protein